MNIKGGVIVLYCKTRWTTAYQSIDDILRTKAVLEEVYKSTIFLITLLLYYYYINNIINKLFFLDGG